MGGGNQVPLAFHLLHSPEEKTPQTTAFLDLTVHRLHNRFALGVDPPSGAIRSIWLAGRTSQCFAVADQLIKIPVLIRDVDQHPLAQHPEQAALINPLKQVEEGGVAWSTGDIQAKGLVEGQPVPSGKALQIP